MAPVERKTIDFLAGEQRFELRELSLIMTGRRTEAELQGSEIFSTNFVGV